MIAGGEGSALWHTRVSRKEHSDGSQLVAGQAVNIDGFECMGLHAGNEVGFPVLRVGGRLLPIVAETDIDGQVVQNLPVVLGEQGVVEVVGISIFTGVLFKGIGVTGDEVRQRIVGACGSGRCEAPYAVVVKRSLLEVFLQAAFTAHIEGMLAACGVEHIASTILVGSSLGTGDGLGQAEPVGVADLSARRESGDAEVRAESGPSIGVRNRNATTKLAGVAQPCLVHSAWADCPGFAHVRILLRRRVVGVSPT